MSDNAKRALERADHAQEVERAGHSAPQTIADYLRHPGIRQQMEMALPKHMSPDRLLRVAMTNLRQTPALANCTPQSFIGALFQAAQLGLEPSNGLGHAWLIPYAGQVQFQLGYKGLLELARRSGQVQSIYAYPVYAADQFDYELGLDLKLVHKPAIGSEPHDEDIRHFYAVAKLKGGGAEVEVMSREQVDAIRDRSKAGKSGPWKTDYAEMGRKTVLKRLCKRLPLSVEVQQAIAQDETVKTSLERDMTLVPDTAETSDVFAGQVEDAEYTEEPAAETQAGQNGDATPCAPTDVETAPDTRNRRISHDEAGEVQAALESDDGPPTTEAATKGDKTALAIALKDLPEAFWKAHLHKVYEVDSRTKLTHAQAIEMRAWAEEQTP